MNALPLVLLSEQFAKLPGIGMKTAQRLAYHVMSMPENDVQEFADAMVNARKSIHPCSVCQNFTDGSVCSICSDNMRDRTTICVVETPKDVSAFERSGEYNGLYHVLHGLISPINGIGPEQLKIKELLSRINGIDEVIMAT
ncbi:MAG TPA: recombination protein RecR, partial [Ruminococcus sp.]|nr:recombination protein RecR [Ruminococcus sp.]